MHLLETFTYLAHAYVNMWVHSTTQVKIKGRLPGLVFSFYCVGSKEGTQLLGFVVFCFEIASHYVTQDLPLPSKCWNCRCVHRGRLLPHISTQNTTAPISPATHQPWNHKLSPQQGHGKLESNYNEFLPLCFLCYPPGLAWVFSFEFCSL